MGAFKRRRLGTLPAIIFRAMLKKPMRKRRLFFLARREVLARRVREAYPPYTGGPVFRRVDKRSASTNHSSMAGAQAYPPYTGLYFVGWISVAHPPSAPPRRVRKAYPPYTGRIFRRVDKRSASTALHRNAHKKADALRRLFTFCFTVKECAARRFHPDRRRNRRPAGHYIPSTAAGSAYTGRNGDGSGR